MVAIFQTFLLFFAKVRRKKTSCSLVSFPSGRHVLVILSFNLWFKSLLNYKKKPAKPFQEEKSRERRSKS